MSKTFIATVHVLVEAESEAQACDIIHAVMDDGEFHDAFTDWGYKAGPTEIEFPEGHEYQEGDFMNRFLPAAHR
jgi:hypothetical protein